MILGGLHLSYRKGFPFHTPFFSFFIWTAKLVDLLVFDQKISGYSFRQSRSLGGLLMVLKPRIGISSCLLGNKVRHDGGHKHEPYITQTLGRHVEWVPVCPELEVGMGVPRETVRLVGRPTKPKMIADKSGKDWTREMQNYADQRVHKLQEMNLSGYILKKTPPVVAWNGSEFMDRKECPTNRGAGFLPRPS
jgi:uncharacterized protein YbbK (DUF523 family)